jgi:micrococcal nuclease
VTQPTNPLPDPVFEPDRRPQIVHHVGIRFTDVAVCTALALFAGFGIGMAVDHYLLGPDLPWFPLTEAVAIDGDTVKAAVTFHIDGIDAAEIDHARCPGQQAMATRARDRLAELLSQAPVRFQVWGEDRFGRLSAYVVAQDRPVAELLVHEGVAQKTNGGPGRWCPDDANGGGPVDRMLATLGLKL